MRQRHRVLVPRLCLVLAVAGLLITTPAFPSGFQIMTPSGTEGSTEAISSLVPVKVLAINAKFCGRTRNVT